METIEKNESYKSDFRVWETIYGNEVNDKYKFQFKVVSYNVLSQCLLKLHPYVYKDCEPSNLEWGVRATKLYDEIKNLDPDILCLQEVQSSHIGSFYSKFEAIGYMGIFKQKTGSKPDGCAIYFKTSVFAIVDHLSVEFNQPDLTILNRDNIGLIVKLVPHYLPMSPIVVATTHLLYNPRRTDVRLAQMKVFLAEIDRFAYERKGIESGHTPIILTGDLNSTPDSAVIKLLSRGFVDVSQVKDSGDWQTIGVTDYCQHLSVYVNRQIGLSTDHSQIKIFHSENSVLWPQEIYNIDPYICPRVVKEMFNKNVIGHGLHLISVYDTVKPNGDYEATTFQDDWVTVDYIYFSFLGSLHLVNRLRLPSATECKVIGSLPNDVYGSDHLALGATFKLNT